MRLGSFLLLDTFQRRQTYIWRWRMHVLECCWRSRFSGSRRLGSCVFRTNEFSKLHDETKIIKIISERPVVNEFIFRDFWTRFIFLVRSLSLTKIFFAAFSCTPARTPCQSSLFSTSDNFHLISINSEAVKFVNSGRAFTLAARSKLLVTALHPEASAVQIFACLIGG